MSGASVFDTFDMVVALSQKTINDQLVHLKSMGAIRDKLIIWRELVNKDFVYHVVDNQDQIPGLAGGGDKPTAECIIGELTPRILIAENGTAVTFILGFTGGQAYFAESMKLVEYDMSGWSYAINVDLNLAELAAKDIKDHVGIPQHVKDQLSGFSQQFFTVQSLFMDLETTQLTNTDPTHTKAGSSGDQGLQTFMFFLWNYLSKLNPQKNPYILGYSLNTSDKTQFKPDQRVPPSVEPVGTTFSVTKNPQSADLSTINFLLVTKDGSGPIKNNVTYSDVWLTAADKVDGKAIFSHKRLAEPLLMKPFFDGFKSQIYNSFKGNLGVDAGMSFQDGMHWNGSSTYNMTVSQQNTHDGDDIYNSSYDVQFNTGHGSGVMTMNSGSLHLYKEHSKNLLLCTARAQISGTVNWNANITVKATKDDKGKPILKPDPSPINVTHAPDWSPHLNDCAKAASVFSHIFGALLDDLLTFGRTDFFEGLLTDAFDVSIGGFRNVDAAFSNVGNISQVVYLPAGQVFEFRDPTFSIDGDLALGLTYLSQN